MGTSSFLVFCLLSFFLVFFPSKCAKAKGRSVIRRDVAEEMKQWKGIDK